MYFSHGGPSRQFRPRRTPSGNSSVRLSFPHMCPSGSFSLSPGTALPGATEALFRPCTPPSRPTAPERAHPVPHCTSRPRRCPRQGRPLALDAARKATGVPSRVDIPHSRQGYARPADSGREKARRAPPLPPARLREMTQDRTTRPSTGTASQIRDGRQCPAVRADQMTA